MAKTVINTFAAATFRIIGNGSTTHNLFTIENTTGSARVVGVRRLVVQLDTLAALTAVMPIVKTSRAGGIPGSGTTLTKNPFDTTSSISSVANVTLRAASGADGGSATSISGAPGTTLWQQYASRMHTLVGQVLAPDNPLIPTLADNTPVILRPNEALLVHVAASAGSSNSTGNQWFVQCVWEEFTE
jgi:hypothetical protein